MVVTCVLVFTWKHFFPFFSAKLWLHYFSFTSTSGFCRLYSFHSSRLLKPQPDPSAPPRNPRCCLKETLIPIHSFRPDLSTIIPVLSVVEYIFSVFKKRLLEWIKVVRMFCMACYLDHCKPLFINLNILTLPSIGIYLQLFEIHKDKNKFMENSDSTDIPPELRRSLIHVKEKIVKCLSVCITSGSKELTSKQI